jgi:hypothetical protein
VKTLKMEKASIGWDLEDLEEAAEAVGDDE